MNHFMARLIFCFFAEDTEVFSEPGLHPEIRRHRIARGAQPPVSDR